MSLLKFTGFDGFVGITGTLTPAVFPSSGPFIRHSGGSGAGTTAQFSADAQRYGTGLGLRVTSSFDSGQDTQNNISNGRALTVNLEGGMIAGNGAVIGTAFRVRGFPQSLAANGVPIGCLSNQAGTGIVGVCITGAGYLILTTTASSPLAVASQPIAENQWYFFEVDFAYNGTAITGIDVYINGTLFLSWTGTITASPVDWTFNFSPNGLWPQPAVRGGSLDYDDFYVIIKDGTAPNTRIGEHRATVLSPTALNSVETTGFTQYGAGTVEEVVGVGSIDGDATGFSTGTVDDQLVLETSYTLPGNVDSIAGYAVTVVARKDGAQERRVSPLVLSGITTDLGTDRSMSDQFGAYQFAWALDPGTSSAWSKSGVEDANFGAFVEGAPA